MNFELRILNFYIEKAVDSNALLIK